MLLMLLSLLSLAASQFVFYFIMSKKENGIVCKWFLIWTGITPNRMRWIETNQLIVCRILNTLLVFIHNFFKRDLTNCPLYRTKIVLSNGRKKTASILIHKITTVLPFALNRWINLFFLHKDKKGAIVMMHFFLFIAVDYSVSLCRFFFLFKYA